MPLRTFDVELTCDRDLHPNAPDTARVEVSAEDVAKWKQHRDYLIAHGLFSIEALDYRCTFLNKYDDNGAERTSGPVSVSFSQDTARVVVSKEGVSFTGFEKHGGISSAWQTNAMLWAELDD
jgi:hypothetical protein